MRWAIAASGHREGVGLAVQVDRGLPVLDGLLEKLGDAEEVVGPHQDVHVPGPLEDLPPLELGHAAADADAQPGLALLQPAEPVEGVVELLRRLLAHRAGVDEDEVRALGIRGRLVPARAQHAGHLLGVVDVHLAAERLDEEARFLSSSSKW